MPFREHYLSPGFAQLWSMYALTCGLTVADWVDIISNFDLVFGVVDR